MRWRNNKKGNLLSCLTLYDTSMHFKTQLRFSNYLGFQRAFPCSSPTNSSHNPAGFLISYVLLNPVDTCCVFFLKSTLLPKQTIDRLISAGHVLPYTSSWYLRRLINLSLFFISCSKSLFFTCCNWKFVQSDQKFPIWGNFFSAAAWKLTVKKKNKKKRIPVLKSSLKLCMSSLSIKLYPSNSLQGTSTLLPSCLSLPPQPFSFPLLAVLFLVSH